MQIQNSWAVLHSCHQSTRVWLERDLLEIQRYRSLHRCEKSQPLRHKGDLTFEKVRDPAQRCSFPLIGNCQATPAWRPSLFHAVSDLQTTSLHRLGALPYTIWNADHVCYWFWCGRIIIVGSNFSWSFKKNYYWVKLCITNICWRNQT